LEQAPQLPLAVQKRTGVPGILLDGTLDRISATYRRLGTALGVADRILMLENSVYSVITPEGCAAILWKDASQRERAAEALKLTAEDLLTLKVIDEVVPEPVGGAHVDPDGAGEALRAALLRHLTELRKVKPDRLVRRRAEKFAAMGEFVES